MIPINVEKSDKSGQINIGLAAGCIAAAVAAIAGIIIAAFLLNRRRKLAQNPDSDQVEIKIIDTNSISNVIDNPLYNLMQNEYDPSII